MTIPLIAAVCGKGTSRAEPQSGGFVAGMRSKTL
jgi:hypothetical protein